MGHGLTIAPRCPSGCGLSLLRPVYADDPDVQPFLRKRAEAAEHQRRSGDYRVVAPPEPEVKLSTGRSLLERPRDRWGRFVKDPERTVQDEHPDEAMTEAEVRALLRRVLSHLPKGSKKPFARLCGYRGRWALHSLRGVGKGRTMLPEAARRRLSRTLTEVFRGEWVLIETDQMATAGRCSHAWRRANNLPRSRPGVPFTP
jgi:hypothetical protein